METKNTRRKLLKTLGLSSGALWVTPIVSGVALPAHGQTSDPAPTVYAIGDTGPGGGIVFYLEPDSGGTGGLEAATSDQSSSAVWGCNGVDVTGATGTAIGTGASNTAAILSAPCPGSNPAAATAAASLGSGWFLPSQDELNELYLQRAVVGGFAVADYWSSSQSSANSARFQNFFNGNQVDFSKNVTVRVRAVRAF